ncbi:hypothetical protein U1Q18_037564, partial [Sarracenia purpurea var. burkii]
SRPSISNLVCRSLLAINVQTVLSLLNSAVSATACTAKIRAHNGKPVKTTKQEQPPTSTPTLFVINLNIKLNQQKNNQSDHGRGYDDDEPLLSPTDGGRCIPIPEVENEDDKVEEFHGFFVNPLSSSSDESAFKCGYLKNVEVSLMPEAAVVIVGRTHQAYVVVLRVKALLPP